MHRLEECDSLPQRFPVGKFDCRRQRPGQQKLIKISSAIDFIGQFFFCRAQPFYAMSEADTAMLIMASQLTAVQPHRKI
jgi:hypothetical protein